MQPTVQVTLQQEHPSTFQYKTLSVISFKYLRVEREEVGGEGGQNPPHLAKLSVLLINSKISFCWRT